MVITPSLPPPRRRCCSSLVGVVSSSLQVTDLLPAARRTQQVIYSLLQINQTTWKNFVHKSAKFVGFTVLNTTMSITCLKIALSCFSKAPKRIPKLPEVLKIWYMVKSALSYNNVIITPQCSGCKGFAVPLRACKSSIALAWGVIISQTVMVGDGKNNMAFPPFLSNK